jgi:hypothetical protein
MCLKRHLARTRSGWPFFRREERMKSQAARLYVDSLNAAGDRPNLIA